MGISASLVGTAMATLLLIAGAGGGCGGLTVGDLREDGGRGTSSGSSGPSPTSPPNPGPLPPSGPFDGSFPAEDGGAPRECSGALVVDATTLPYKSPVLSVGACTAANLTALTTYVDGGGTFPGWKTSVPAPCATCIFGRETDALWKPLLENSIGELVAINVGGCIAIASGSDGCGRAYQQWFDCRFEACADCSDGDSAALQKCMAAASKGSCKKAIDAVTLTCGGSVIADSETACDGAKYVFEGPIRAQCIGL